MPKKISFQLNPLVSKQAITSLTSVGSNYREIPLELLELDPSQPRKTLNEAEILKLADSIKEVGLLQPLVVQEKGGGKFLIISGERRYRACKLLGLSKIPCILANKQVGENDFKLITQLIENIQREDLNPADKADAIYELHSKFGLSIRDIASKLGMSKSAVHRSLQIAQLPTNLKDMLRHGHPESKVLKLAQTRRMSSKPSALAKVEVLKYQSLATEIFQQKCKIKASKREINLCLSFKDMISLAAFLSRFSAKHKPL